MQLIATGLYSAYLRKYLEYFPVQVGDSVNTYTSLFSHPGIARRAMIEPVLPDLVCHMRFPAELFV